VTVQFVGSGDAFGSGGRFQACIAVRYGGGHLALDLGASSLTAMRQIGLEPGAIDAVVLTHLHGDHFGGIPFLVLDAQFARREKPLVIVGPSGVSQRVSQAMEVFFPGSSRVEQRFETRFLELTSRRPVSLLGGTITAYEVPHASGAPAHALRLEIGDTVIAYSGDTEWSESLVEVSRGADLFICEAYSFEKPIKNHLSYATLRQHRARLDCRRLVLTHMGAEMLERLDEVGDEAAQDGLMITL
jgi:ribonuclease BN (tRNA processing enzyme)